MALPPMQLHPGSKMITRRASRFQPIVLCDCAQHLRQFLDEEYSLSRLELDKILMCDAVNLCAFLEDKFMDNDENELFVIVYYDSVKIWRHKFENTLFYTFNEVIPFIHVIISSYGTSGIFSTNILDEILTKTSICGTSIQQLVNLLDHCIDEDKLEVFLKLFHFFHEDCSAKMFCANYFFKLANFNQNYKFVRIVVRHIRLPSMIYDDKRHTATTSAILNLDKTWSPGVHR